MPFFDEINFRLDQVFSLQSTNLQRLFIHINNHIVSEFT